MRLDKYLKISRLIKRRTIANELCDAGKVIVNGKVAKASYEIKENDVLELNILGQISRIKVTKVLSHTLKESAKDMYTNLQ